MRPSVRAEKYIRDASGAEKTDNGTDGQTDVGQTADRRTDRVRRIMRPPPREEGRIKSPNHFYSPDRLIRMLFGTGPIFGAAWRTGAPY